MQASKWPLTTWFLVFDLIGQAKTGISSLELSRHLGVNDDTALLHNKILRAMTEREEAYLLRGKIQIDDSYLGGELPGGKTGRGSENKIPIVTSGKHPSDLPQFRWINTLLGNLKTSFNGTFHAFNLDKYARRYLGGTCFGFNRRFSLATMTERIANAGCCCMPCSERDLRVAEFYG